MLRGEVGAEGWVESVEEREAGVASVADIDRAMELGYDIFNEIRTTMPEFAHIPIIAVSASEPSFAIPQTRKMGFSGFIGKPISKQLFPVQLSKILDGEQVWYATNAYSGSVS